MKTKIKIEKTDNNIRIRVWVFGYDGRQISYENLEHNNADIEIIGVDKV